jgi:hypothetical protein
VSSPGRFGVSSPRPLCLCQRAAYVHCRVSQLVGKHFALQFAYRSILGGNKFSCWLPCHGTPPPLGCRIFRGERLAPNTALLVLSQSVVRVPPLALQRETRSLWSALAPARWHKRRREETPKRPCEDTQALPFSGKEKRRDLAFQDAEWRTWTLQSANCCVKTKLVSVQKQWRSKRNSKTRAKTVNFNLKLPSVEKEVTLVPGKFGSRWAIYLALCPQIPCGSSVKITLLS